MATTDMWSYRNSALTTRDLTGYKVEALDGDIGKIDEATNEVGGSFVVVDTGPWIFLTSSGLSRFPRRTAGVTQFPDRERRRIAVGRASA